MTTAFADAYYYFALLDPHDPGHDRAVEFTRNHRGRYLNTDWVLVEVADGLARSNRGRRAFRKLWSELFSSDSVTTVVRCEIPLLHKGVVMYDHYTDEGWSLTDCISFVVMSGHKLTGALTADNHFIQAGFVALLR
jgi:uncharacterized protein